LIHFYKRFVGFRLAQKKDLFFTFGGPVKNVPDGAYGVSEKTNVFIGK